MIDNSRTDHIKSELEAYFQRGAPQAAFTANLRQRLLTEAGKVRALPRRSISFPDRIGLLPIWRYIVTAVLAIALCIGFILAVSPSARAVAQHLLQQIVIFKFEETDQLTIPAVDGFRLVDISQEEAQTALSFPIKLPTWLPEGFPMEPKFQGPDPNDPDSPDNLSAMLAYWEGPMGTIHLTMYPYTEEIRKHYEVKPEKVGKNSVREVTVHGESAVLLNGLWSSKIYKNVPYESDDPPETLTWNPEGGGSILWVHEEYFYILFWGAHRDAEAFLTPEQAVRIAESIP